MRGTIPGDPVITSHPDHVRSLFTAKPEQAPSITGESPLRPIVGSNSVLTAVGPRHMRQRKLLLPPFHGEAIAQYAEMITRSAEREIETWRPGDVVELAPRMQAITLDVIMAGIFGIEGRPEPGSPEEKLRRVIRGLTEISTTPMAKAGELVNSGRTEAVGLLKVAVGILDRATYRVIEERRRAERPERARRHHVDPARGRDRGRREADRPRGPRRAPDPRARRARDDGQLARLGRRAARPQSRGARRLRDRGPRRGRRDPRRVDRGGDPRDDAGPPRGPDHRPPRRRSVAARATTASRPDRRSR